MSEQRTPLVETVLRQHFSSLERPVPRLSRRAVEVLLSDDSQRRLRLAERAAAAWGRTATLGLGPLAAGEDRLLVTSEGLVYVARLRTRGRATAPSPAAEASADPAPGLFYLAAPARLFDSVVDCVRAIAEPLTCIVAVDGRFGQELHYPWPLDTGLRQTLGSHEVLIGR